MSVKITRSNNNGKDNVYNMTFANDLTKKRNANPEDDISDRFSKRPHPPSASCSNNEPNLLDDTLIVDNAAVLEDSDGEFVRSRTESPSFDPTQPTLRYQFTSSKRTVAFEVPHFRDGSVAPVGILDTEDKTLKLLRNEKEDLRKLYELPEFDKAFCSVIDRFRNCPKDHLEKLLNSSPYGDEVYVRVKHAEARYVQQATGAILSMIETLKSCHWLGHKSLQEGWYAANVWGPLIDRCFHTLDNCLLSRTEIKSKTDFGENRRFDGIVAALAGEQVAEFGAIEVAKNADMISSNKEITDGDKLVVVLGSMLRELLARIDYDMETAKRLCVVGIQHIGFSMRVIRMYAVTKDVFVIHRGPKRYVPTSLDSFDNVFEIMKSIVLVKCIVADSMERINEFNRRKLAPEDPNDHYKDFVP